MVVGLVDVHRADEVDRADELQLDVPSQVAAVEEAEVAEAEELDDAVGVVGQVARLVFRVLAQRVLGGAGAAVRSDRCRAARHLM